MAQMSWKKRLRTMQGQQQNKSNFKGLGALSRQRTFMAVNKHHYLWPFRYSASSSAKIEASKDALKRPKLMEPVIETRARARGKNSKFRPEEDLVENLRTKLMIVGNQADLWWLVSVCQLHASIQINSCWMTSLLRCSTAKSLSFLAQKEWGEWCVRRGNSG